MNNAHAHSICSEEEGYAEQGGFVTVHKRTACAISSLVGKPQHARGFITSNVPQGAATRKLTCPAAYLLPSSSYGLKFEDCRPLTGSKEIGAGSQQSMDWISVCKRMKGGACQTQLASTAQGNVCQRT
eukprot:1146258-Pelagomonas_calceolata.AAC.2